MVDVDGGDFSGSNGTTTPTGDWYIPATIQDVWNRAPANLSFLQQLCDAAKQEVLAFDNGYNWRRNPANNGTPFPGDYGAGEVPTNLLLAQMMQIKNLNNASLVNPQGNAGDDSFTLTPFPLDWVVKQVIRPKTTGGSWG